MVRNEFPPPPADAGAPPSVSAWDLRSSLQALAQSQMLGSDGRVPVDIQALGRFVGDDGGVLG
ncbi:hypothetical protein F5Y19DRAFT_424204 [Xylariaceae sp. FL1651]|nr:hypothetical protein F5Y19DRAFT_424204 [Xylariaceae sp. FL1651]